jgi:hypothetical protein
MNAGQNRGAALLELFHLVDVVRLKSRERAFFLHAQIDRQGKVRPSARGLALYDS